MTAWKHFSAACSAVLGVVDNGEPILASCPPAAADGELESFIPDFKPHDF
jgi:hypothetical protein